MEKLLAMSILSSTPADTSCSWLDVAAAMWKTNNNPKAEKEYNNGSSDRSLKKQKQKSAENRAWFAPEFDGLNCFETFVSH